MNKSFLYGVFLFIAISMLLGPSSYAAIVVYTDRAEWETDITSGPFDHFHHENFEGRPVGRLLAGPSLTNFFFPLDVIIGGPVGHNAIDDSFTPDPFSDSLSPNGSVYYFGEVNMDESIVPILSFPELEFQVTGFGADWVIAGDLVMEIQGTQISFRDYLPTGHGFLGIMTYQPETPLESHLSGAAFFGMDNISSANVPIPAAIWLFGSGLLAIVGMAKQAKWS